MANPSLQIGDSNWAIKEDNLLGYSKAGTRFVPEPITMTRASAGTRVNSEGLVETVELLGSDGIEDGDFPSGTTEWTVSDGTVSFDNGATFDIDSKIYQLDALVTGKIYKATYEITDNVGGMTLRFYNGGAYFNVDGSVGVHTVYFTALPSNTRFYINAQTGTSLVLKNISLKEVTRNDLARVDYTDGTSSLLVEPERTNLLEYSEDFSQSYWRKDKLTLTSNSIISPSGELNASLIQETVYTSSMPSFDLQNSTTLSAGTYTYTFYVKNNNGRYLGISFGSSGERVRTNFDFTTNTFKTLLFSGTTTGTASFTILGDFYKITITATFPSSIPADTVVMPLATDTYPYYANQDSDNRSFYLWGFSVQEGSYATSYIPTDGGIVTRVQDQYTKTGISDLINSEEGVLFAEMAALSTSIDSGYLSLNNGGNYQIRIGYLSGNIYIQIRINGSVPYFYSFVGTISDFNKIAVKWTASEQKVYVNGSPVDTGVASTIFPTDTLNNMEFAVNGATPLFAKVKQLQVYKTALTDPELVTLTT